jgi:hypothetical protein
MAVVDYEVLWHRVRVDVPDDAVAPTGHAPSPVQPPLTTCYRIEHVKAEWRVFQDDDLLESVDGADAAWATIDARVGIRAFEVAALQGWVPFMAHLVADTSGRTLVVGTRADRARMVRKMCRDGARCEAADGIVVRGGKVLPVTVRGSNEASVRDVTGDVGLRVDRILSPRYGRGRWAVTAKGRRWREVRGSEAMAILVASAWGKSTREADVVAAVASLLRTG